MLETIAFAICSLAAFGIVVLCYAGILHDYGVIGDPNAARVDIQRKLWYLVIFGFVAGCVLELL